MVITISGVTGVGKSYLKNQIEKRLNIQAQVIVTTRQKRKDEIEGKDKNFVTVQQFEELKRKKDIILTFEYLGNQYGYDKKQMESIEDSVVELHYSSIYQLKKEIADTFSIYMIPKDIEIAKQKLRERKLPHEVEEKRIKEIEEHIKVFKEDKNLRQQFNYIFFNDYTDESIKNVISIVKEACESKKIKLVV